MELTINKLSNQVTQSTTTHKKMRLSENASSFVFQMFTKNVYSNPIGTVVREITSNCFDSHIEAKTNAPIIIKQHVDSTTGTNYISFIDFGVGMSPDRIENIYGVYFESTKRNNNDEIGGFGIGAKSVLAYKRSTGIGEAEYDNSFYVVTIYNGIKYMYCVYEGEDSPIISLLHQEKTSEGNGTEIRVPVLESDMYKFKTEITRQLYYFENIIFEGFDEDFNDYKIVRGENFWYRGDKYSDYMHICLGRVAYPIDYNALGLSQYDFNIPIAIKLNVGDVNVTVSRESLDYSETTIKLLKKKLVEVKQELVDMLTKQYEEIVSLEDYFKLKNKFGYLYLTKDITINIGNLVKEDDVKLTNFKYGFMDTPSDKQLFSFFFNVKQYGKKSSRYNNDNVLNYIKLTRDADILYVEDEFKRKVIKQSYLNNEFERFFIVTKRDINKLHKYDIATLFKLSGDVLYDVNNNVLPIMQSILEMQEEYMSIVREYCTNYDTLEIPENFIESRKCRATKNMLTESIVVRFGNGNRFNIQISDLLKFNGVIFYGNNEERDLTEKYESLFEVLFTGVSTVYKYGWYRNNIHNFGLREENKKIAMFITIAKSNFKYMKYCKKAHHIDEFKDKMLKRKVNAIQEHFDVKTAIEKYNSVSDIYKRNDFELINGKWGKIINSTVALYDKLSLNYIKDYNDYSFQLSSYINLSNVKKSNEIEKFENYVDDLIQLENNNNGILRYIDMYRYTDLKPVLIDILQKTMIF